MNNLNKEQQKLVEDNHNLIYSFAKSRMVDTEEYYDVFAIGLCKAALIYDKSKGAFSTLAYKCMSNEYHMIRSIETRQKTIPESLIISLDEPIGVSEEDGNESTLYDYIIKDVFPTPENSTVNSIVFNDFYNSELTKQQQDVVKILLQGETQFEISKMLGLTHQRISAIVHRIREKWVKFNK
ncbi:MAG: sigma-70 family RNA polymerase sigma factor [Clostridia bacterium]|nr:sigma-70 family RNA polymerase sigma factor [Clostridia bacterium]